MKTISMDRTVTELVQDRPARSRVFESLGIGYCCAGKKTLREACETAGLRPPEVLAILKAADAEKKTHIEADLDGLTLGGLIGDIVSTHHGYLRGELPRLETLMKKVASVHGGRDARLHQMRHTLVSFTQDIDQHMAKEEEILFPAIVRLESRGATGSACFGSLRHPIAQMEAEHEEAGDALLKLRALSDGFAPPDWACNTYRALLDGLRELEEDMVLHVHKEDDKLFPRAIQLEDAAPVQANA